MIYLGVFYRNDGKMVIQEFSTINAIKIWWREQGHKYITYDIYMAKCINKRITLGGKYDKYIRNI